MYLIKKSLLFVYLLVPLRYNFYKRKKKIDTYNQPNTPAVTVPLFAIEKVKTTKNLLDKKALAASASATAAPTL